MNVDFRLPKRRDIKVAKYTPQMGLRDRSAGRADRGPSDASWFARPPTLSVWTRHPVKHVLKSRRQRTIVLRGHEQQCIRDGDLRFYALHRLRWILVMILIEDRQIIDAHEFALEFLWCKFHQRFRKFEVDRLLADAAHDYGDFGSHNDLLRRAMNYGLWPAETKSPSFATISANVGVRRQRPRRHLPRNASTIAAEKAPEWRGCGEVTSL